MKTLLLNADYSPYDIISWKSAMTKVLCDNNVVVVLNSHKLIRDGKGNVYHVPSIIALKTYRNVIDLPAPYSKANIWARDKRICQYCGIKLESHNLTIDHVIPRSKWKRAKRKGSVSCYENVVTCCSPCNSRKGDMTPVEAGMKLIRQPKRVNRATILKNKVVMYDLPKEWEDYIH